MSNELIQFTFDGQTEENDSADFRYDVLDHEDREFVQEREYAVKFHHRTAVHEIIATGKELRSAQKRLKQANKGKHGTFKGWLKKIGIEPPAASFCMKAHDRFGDDKNFASEIFSPGAFKELTYASDETVQKIKDGEIDPTKKAIREAEEAQKKAKQAEEAERQARIAAAKARADAQAAQQQLFNNQETSQAEIKALTQQINALKDEMETLTTPEIEIREIEKEVVPQSVKLQIEALQQQAQTLTNDIETQKKTIPPETQRTLESLQKQVERLKEERERQEATLAAQKERITKQNEDIQAAIRKREFAENQDRIRQNWRQSTSEAHSCLMRVLGQWPTPVDAQSFDADDWARVDHLKNTLKRVVEECNALQHQVVIDDEQAQSPYGLVIESR